MLSGMLFELTLFSKMFMGKVFHSTSFFLFPPLPNFLTNFTLIFFVPCSHTFFYLLIPLVYCSLYHTYSIYSLFVIQVGTKLLCRVKCSVFGLFMLLLQSILTLFPNFKIVANSTKTL